MAFDHIHFDDQTQYGRMLRSFLNKAEQSDDEFTDVRGVMIKMRDGDGTLDAHYAEVTARFGFSSDAQSRAAFQELESAYSKTSGNGAVTDTRAARDQLFDKMRG